LRDKYRTLTTGIDTFPGTSGNDIYQGDSANIGGLDKMFAAGGTADTLNLTSTAAAVTLSSNNITGMEVINFTAGGANGAHTATLGGLSGITNVNNSGSTVGLVIGAGANSLTSLAAVGISNLAQATTVVFQEAAVTGSADAVTVTLSGVTGAVAVNVDTEAATATVAGAIETINIVSTGSTNSITLDTIDTQGLGTVNVSGANNITIALGTNAATDAIILNASTATGTVTITGIGAGNTFAAVATGHTITGGSGNDTFAFAANYVGAEAAAAGGTRDVINGGGGIDRISMTVARVVAASTTAQANLTSIEALTISDAWTNGLAIDITKFTDVTALTLTGATGTSTATVNSGTTVTLAADTGTGLTTFAIAGTGTADTLNLNMAGFDFDGAGADAFTGIENLNINTGATITTASVFTAAQSLTQSAGATLSTIVATGNNGLTFTGAVTGAGTIDASALVGVLTVTGAAAAAITIRGGSANDTINGSAAADLLVGNAGNDALLGAGGADTIQGDAGTDTITGGTGVDTMTGGAAADTFAFAAGDSGGIDGTAIADVITDFLAGTDKLQFTGVTDIVSVQQAAVQAAVTALAAGSTDAAIATAMALANTTVVGVSFAVFNGSTYVLVEPTNTADFVVADNIFIKLVGLTTAPTFAADVVA
jgi:hypothetical protein